MTTDEIIDELSRLRRKHDKLKSRRYRQNDESLRRYCLRPRSDGRDEMTSRRQRQVSNQVLTQWRVR